MNFFNCFPDKIHKTIEVIFASFEWSGCEANALENI